MSAFGPVLASVLVLGAAGACGADGDASGDAAMPFDAAAQLDGPGPDDAADDDAGASGDSNTASDDGGVPPPDAGTDPPARGVVHVVLFTHIEDNTPAGMLGSAMSRTAYTRLRARLVEMAELAARYGLPWVLQPDWRFLEAALLYEDAATTADTGGRNLFVHLRDELGVAIDPHSHENGGYNYTDVAYLLERLGVGGSTVIGGHIWDPALPQFQQWDRFRAPVAGERYPEASWRGDILIGAGTPMHVNDPLASGVWRPRDRDRFFDDDPAGNVVAVGAWTRNLEGVRELVALHEDGTVAPEQLLTASWNIGPSTLTSPTGLADVEAQVLLPLAALRDEGAVVVTDFTTLVDTWRRDYGARSSLYRPL
ncbi:MAG: hypothetical protein IT379_12425 [Deltaproteobacteria bacterium]|nr:hypothetical protein [Deltaproteobacteria bacterium]